MSETNWTERADYHSREVQAIKRMIRHQSNSITICEEYIGLNSERLNYLRYQLAAHDLGWSSAYYNRRNPTKEELRECAARLPARVRANAPTSITG